MNNSQQILSRHHEEISRKFHCGLDCETITRQLVKFRGVSTTAEKVKNYILANVSPNGENVIKVELRTDDCIALTPAEYSKLKTFGEKKQYIINLCEKNPDYIYISFQHRLEKFGYMV